MNEASRKKDVVSGANCDARKQWPLRDLRNIPGTCTGSQTSGG